MTKVKFYVLRECLKQKLGKNYEMVKQDAGNTIQNNCKCFIKLIV